MWHSSAHPLILFLFSSLDVTNFQPISNIMSYHIAEHFKTMIDYNRFGNVEGVDLRRTRKIDVELPEKKEQEGGP